MPTFRGILLFFFALVPLVTLFHPGDTGHWETQHSAMAAPDEFSYLLMAQHFLQGGGLSLKADLGLDTFYPPGYPLLLAFWSKFFFHGTVTAFAAHALNTALLCIDTVIVYFFSKRLLSLLSNGGHRQFALTPDIRAWIALIIAALFATNWHVLETSLLIMSEPLFMLVTFLWLALALKWPRWHESLAQAALVTALATLAWSVRGAGIVCVAATVIYPFISNILRTCDKGAGKISWVRPPAPALITWLIPLSYQVVLIMSSPEKSLVSGQGNSNSYTRQLLHGLDAGAGTMLLSHLNDYAASFVPWPRENPDYHFRDIIGKTMGFFGLLGFLFHLQSGFCRQPRQKPQPGNKRDSHFFIQIYVFIYFGLYLLWPFNFARFWSPILPIMLAYAADALVRFVRLPRALPRFAAAWMVLGLLLVLSAQEVSRQMDNYARRLNYVSDSIADAAARIPRESPDPRRAVVAVMGSDEHFALAWNFSRLPGHAGKPAGGYFIRSPGSSDVGAPNVNPREHADQMLIRTFDEIAANTQPRRLFFFSYFPENNLDTRDTLAGFSAKRPNARIVALFRKEIIASIWEIILPPQFPDPAATSAR